MKSTLAVCALALLTTACATVPPPTDLLAAAELSVKQANASRGEEDSSPELRAARIKLAAAHDAVTRREMLEATRLAQEAKLDADVSAARSELARAEFNVETLKKTNEALRQQSLRNSVNVAPIAIPSPIAAPDTSTTENY